jgi:AcrR family transcriptional regulator
MSKHRTRQISRIVQATLNLIGDDGLSGLNISKVAEAAGMTRQTIYSYFPDVGAIIEAALEEHGKAMERHLLETIADAASPHKKLLAFAHFQISIASSGHENVFLEAALPHEARQRLEQHSVSVKRELRRAIQAGIRSGDFTDQIDPAITAELVWGFAKAAASAATMHPDEKPYFREAVEKAMWAILHDQNPK